MEITSYKEGMSMSQARRRLSTWMLSLLCDGVVVRRRRRRREEEERKAKTVAEAEGVDAKDGGDVDVKPNARLCLYPWLGLRFRLLLLRPRQRRRQGPRQRHLPFRRQPQP